MARPSREAIDSFMSITGAPESLAVQKLEEHGSDLNEAVNAHFSQGDRSTALSPRADESSVGAPIDDMMDIDAPVQDVTQGSMPSLISEPRNVDPILDARLSRSLLDGISNFTNQVPIVTHPRELRQIPVEIKDGSGVSDNPENAPRIEDVTEAPNAHGPDVHGTVIVDDEENDVVATGPNTAHHGHSAHDNEIRSSAPVYNDLPDYGNDIEEEMVRAAIEASKKEAERGYNEENNLGSLEPARSQSHMEDPELAHAVSLSIEMAEREKALREREHEHGEKVGAPSGRLDVGSSSIQDEAEDFDQQPLIRNRSRSTLSASPEDTLGASPPSSPTHDMDNHLQHNRDTFASDEWGGISSLEHDEAVMLEAAMFGGIPEEHEHRFPYGPRPFAQSELPYAPWVPRPPSPSLEAQRLIREQQDDEYLASLQADREKEQRAQAEAEARRLEREAAREIALKEEKEREEENRRILEEQQELERQLTAKEASLPHEPSADDENAITLLVRMPDGSRHGRRFLKSDMLQLLFDFIDVERVIKPGTYRVVRPYPRRAFSDGESSLTLNELGLTSKQEALFLELI